jgi:hypothetical protein
MIDITQARICAQPLVGRQLKRMNAIQNSNLPQYEKERLRAVTLKGILWPQQSIIYIKFVGQVPINIRMTEERDYAKKLINNNYFLGFLGPTGDIDPATKKPKIYRQPYRTKEGYVIDQNDKPIILDPLHNKCSDLMNKAKSTRTFDKVVKDCIKMITKERLEPFINLTFVYLENNSPIVPNIRIGFNGSEGAWSYLGNQNNNIRGNQKTMNLGWFDVPTVIHEFGHMLGLSHEHQGPSEGDFKNKLIWNTNALYKWGRDTQDWDRNTVNAQIINRLKKSEINDISAFKNGVVDRTLLEYDPDSIMLYFYEGYLTYDPVGYYSKPQILKPGPGTTQNTRLSVKDVKYLNAVYPGPRKDGSKTMTGDEFIKANPDLFKKTTVLRSMENYDPLRDTTPAFDCKANAGNCANCNLPQPQQGTCTYSNENMYGNIPCLKGVPFTIDGQQFVCPAELEDTKGGYYKCDFSADNASIPYLIGAGISLGVFVIILLIVLKVKKVI